MSLAVRILSTPAARLSGDSVLLNKLANSQEAIPDGKSTAKAA